MAEKAEGNGGDGKVFDISEIGDPSGRWRSVFGGSEDDVSKR